MCSVLVAIYIGYKIGIFRTPGGYYGKLTVVHLFRISLYITLLLFLPTFIYRTGGDFSLGLDLLTNPSVYYLRSHSEEDFTGTSWIEYIRIILSVFLNLLIPLLVVYWNRINIPERCLGIFAILLNIFLWTAVGTNKGIGDTAVILFWALIIRNQKIIIDKIMFLAVPLILFFIFFFIQGQIDRHGGEGVQDTIYISNYEIKADRDSLIVGSLPFFAKEGVIAFTSYWVQGYNGLALCLNEPFVPTFGLGNSRFLTTYADKYLGTNIEQTTYPARTEETTGWESKKQWHTIFPWIASDVTFPGTVFLVSIFSFLFALSWVDSIHLKNPYALSIFSQFSIMFTYITANNQVLQSGDGFIGFFVTLFMWFYTRYKFVIMC